LRPVLPRHPRHRLVRGHQELGQLPLDARTNRPRRVLLLLDQRRRNDHIGVDRPERNAQIERELFTPRFGLPQRVLVADDGRCAYLVDERKQPVMGVAPQHEADAPPPQAADNVGQAFDQKLIVAEVGALDAGVQTEEDDHRLPQRVAQRDRGIERGVVPGPLRALHPVDDARAVGVRRPLRPLRDAGIVVEWVHGWRHLHRHRALRSATGTLH
jgi:hypothetical protein